MSERLAGAGAGCAPTTGPPHFTDGLALHVAVDRTSSRRLTIPIPDVRGGQSQQSAAEQAIESWEQRGPVGYTQQKSGWTEIIQSNCTDRVPTLSGDSSPNRVAGGEKSRCRTI